MIRTLPRGRHSPKAEGVCDFCGRTEAVPIDLDNRSRNGFERANEGQAIRKLIGKGWSNLGGKLRCPDCEAVRRKAKDSLPPEGVKMTFAPLAKPVVVSPGEPVDPAIPGLLLPGITSTPPKDGAYIQRRERIREYFRNGVTNINELAALLGSGRGTVRDDLYAMGLQYTTSRGVAKRDARLSRESIAAAMRNRHAKITELFQSGVTYYRDIADRIGENPTTVSGDMTMLGLRPGRPRKPKPTTETTEPDMTKTDTTTPQITPPKPGASTEPPRQPTIAQRRAIRDMLDVCYDMDGQQYTGGETDFTVATALGGGVLPGWVAEIRDEWYGPDGNADLAKLLAEQDALNKRMAEWAKDFAALAEATAALDKRRKDLDGAIALLNERVTRMKASLGPKGERM